MKTYILKPTLTRPTVTPTPKADKPVPPRQPLPTAVIDPAKPMLKLGLDVHLDFSMAVAHKLARILWHLLKFKQPFNPEVFAKEEAKMKRRKLARLQNMAAALNYQLVPQP